MYSKKITLKILSYLNLITIIALLFLNINNNQTIYAKENENYNFTNLIVFLRFNEETEFLNDICGNKTTVKQAVENSYEKADYSVYDYYKRVSNNKVKIQNMYLFDEYGGSLVLNHKRGYYCKKDTNNPEGYESYEYQLRMAELKQDWSNTINTTIKNGNKITDIDHTLTYDFKDLDQNNDGSIDSLTIIYKYSNQYSVAWSDCLWNYQTFYDGVTITNGNKTIQSGQYLQLTANFNYLYSDKNGLEFYSLKTMIHEMGHIFGLKDLYRNESNSRVYYMSTMSNAISPVPQYISSKEREALGWIENKNIKTITEEGTYTINVTKDELNDEVVCYKFNLKNSNKCVYLEYRNFKTELNKYDFQSKDVYNQNGNKISGINIKSGLVCFLSDKDTIFPNNLHTSGSYWNYEVLGGIYSTKVDSALGEGDNLDITLNLNIEVLEMTTDKITFKIKGTDIDSSHKHTIEKIEPVNASCENDGNIKYYHCSTCNKYYSDENLTKGIALSDTIINKLGHDEIIVPGMEPICQEEGLTDGKKCSRCDQIIISQEKISKKPHRESNWIIDKVSTTTTNGEKHKECLDCHEILKVEIIYFQDNSNNQNSNQTQINLSCQTNLFKIILPLFFISINVLLIRKKEF